MSDTDRRGLIGAGALMAGAGLVATGAKAQSSSSGSGWKPTLEEQDNWLDIPGTRHRMLFDSTSPEGAAAALNYADNFFRVNKDGYGLEPETLGVVVMLRHIATPFAYTNDIWAEYGAPFAKLMELDAAKAYKANKANPLLNTDGEARQTSLETLIKKGARFGVCGAATHFVANMLSKDSGKSPDEIYKKLAASLVPNATMTPAGIVAVNRAQERGYTFSFATE